MGKSTLVRLFAKAHDLTLHEVDLERHPQLAETFASRDLGRILRELEFLIGLGPIRQANSLLFLDEIQAVPEAIAALRDFHEDLAALPVIAAGSLLEFALGRKSFSMPVGRIEYLYLEPMSIEEFLEALGEEDLLELLRGYAWEQPFPHAAHERLLDRQRDYLLVGGMPEAVLRFAETGEFRSVGEAHASILETYRDDFSKYSTRVEHRLVQKVFDFVPRSAGDKFKFVRVDEREQSRNLRRALDLLAMARVIRLAYHTDGTGIPLAATRSDKVFKPYFLDVGLVSAACGITWISSAAVRDKSFINEGKLAEQFIAQHIPLLADLDRETVLTYWLREGRARNAEVDFLIQLGADIVPVEVKAGKSGSLKSLLQFLQARELKKALRFDLNPPSRMFVEHSPTSNSLQKPLRFDFRSLPLYLVEQAPRLWEIVSKT